VRLPTILPLVAALLWVIQGCAVMQEQREPLGGPAVANVVQPRPVTLRPERAEIGQASWYGPRFHGRKTASGAIFDQSEYTAAHPKLPLGSRVRVINLENDKSVEVEINDRGPFVPGRIIDLSRAAARELGMLEDGLTRVRIELLALPPGAKF
jgi:rare lipoprotein A